MPDADLLAAVVARLRDGRFHPSEYDGNQVATDAWNKKVALAALEAAGRVLAERLRADAGAMASAAARTGPDGDAEAFRVAAVTYRDAAGSVARWCGAEPEGDGNGA